MTDKNIKIVLVGDGAVGKTSLALAFMKNPLKESYEPTIADVYAVSITINGQKNTAKIWDTAGQEAYASLREMAYDDTDVFILCFDITSPISLSNVENAWAPELNEKAPKVPIILAGTKIDLRTDTKVIQKLKAANRAPISSNQGLQMAKTIKAKSYQECSAVLDEGVQDVFKRAAKAAIEAQKKKSKLWCISCSSNT